MKKITYKELDEILENYKCYDCMNCFGDVQIQRMSETDEPIEFGINWGGCGACNLQEVEKFTEKLNEAKEVCEELNTKLEGYVLVWSKEN